MRERPTERRLPGRGARLALAAVGLALAALAAYAAGTVEEDPAGDLPVAFTDVERQTREFIGYFHSIELTPEQEEVKREALLPLSAPCCHDRSAHTCCCPCNMAKSWWGLSKHLIADLGLGVEEVRSTVAAWFEFINPDGFSGNTCYTGGCNRPFRENGCGGMSESRLTF